MLEKCKLAKHSLCQNFPAIRYTVDDYMRNTETSFEIQLANQIWELHQRITNQASNLIHHHIFLQEYRHILHS